MPNYSTCSSIYMLTSLLRIFTKEKEKQCRFIVNNFMNQPTNRNILWDVTRSRVSARKFINLTESRPTRLFAITVTYNNKYFKRKNRAKQLKGESELTSGYSILGKLQVAYLSVNLEPSNHLLLPRRLFCHCNFV